MRKYLSIFNIHTVLVVLVSLASSAVCLYFQLEMFFDFLILSLVIFFPLTFSMTAAFRRRERALQYLSLFKASLQSIYYVFLDAKIEHDKKKEFENVASGMSETLLRYLLDGTGNSSLQDVSHAVFNFAQANKESLKPTFTSKLYFFMFRLNESIEFLIATKRHRTPWGVRALIIFVIYSFIIVYPASLLHDVGFAVPLWYVFKMTAFKGILLICFYNAQSLLEDPFNQKSPDGIRLNDFKFSPVVLVEDETPAVTVVETTPKPDIQTSE